MKNNQNDIEPEEEPIIYKNFDYKFVVISMIVTPIIFLIPWKGIKTGIFFLLLLLHNWVFFKSLYQCLLIRKKGNVSTDVEEKILFGSEKEINYFYTYAEEKITLSKILAQVFRCIILATIFIIVCILSRFTLLSPTLIYDSHYIPYDYLQWIPMLIAFYFVFLYFDVIFLQKRYRITIKKKKVSSEHVSRIDGELYYINPGEEISQEKDIKEMTPEEKASKKELIFCIIIFGIILIWNLLDAKNLGEVIYILLMLLIYPIIIPLLKLVNKRKKSNNQEKNIEEDREENIITQQENIEDREENIITQQENIEKRSYKSRRYIIILCIIILLLTLIMVFALFNSFNQVTF